MTREELIERLDDFAYTAGELVISQRDYDKLVEYADQIALYADETMSIILNSDGIKLRFKSSKKANLLVANGHLQIFYFYGMEQGTVLDPFPESFDKLQQSQ